MKHQQQLCFNKLQQRTADNGFRLSKNKNICMHICQKTYIPLDLLLFFEQVLEETNYPVAVFDRRLTFVPHLKCIKQKAL